MKANSPITTHVLDTAIGRPAEGIEVSLVRYDQKGWTVLARGKTDHDGRVRDLLPSSSLVAGRYRLTFATREYHERLGMAAFYPEVVVDFEVTAAQDHYHVPLLLSPFGYSTYRGS